MSDVSTDTNPQPGQRFGKYEIIRVLGQGGMGTVYEAMHADLKKRVALKTLNSSVAMNSDAVRRFLREGETASRIDHPHVVDVTDVGVQAGVPFLVMEYLEGEDLSARLAKQGPFATADLVDLSIPVLAAVAAAHEEGVIHRDLKPHNVFLARTKQGQMRPILLDFGISKVAETAVGADVTKTSSMLGTPLYMSPEQIMDSKSVDARSDQYSFGVILYECATGVVPFNGSELYHLLAAIVRGPFLLPTERRPEVGEGLERIILRAMSRDPAQRYPDMKSLGRALLPLARPHVAALWKEAFEGSKESLDDSSTPARSVNSTLAHSDTALQRSLIDRPSARTPWIAAGGVGTILALLATGGYVLTRGGPGEPVPTTSTLVHVVAASASVAPASTTSSPVAPLIEITPAASASAAASQGGRVSSPATAPRAGAEPAGSRPAGEPAKPPPRASATGRSPSPQVGANGAPIME